MAVAPTPSYTVAESTASPAGTTISALIPDGYALFTTGATEAIAISALDVSLGTWQYQLSGTTTWLTIDPTLLNSTTNNLSLLLGPNDSIRLLPYGDSTGTVSTGITFRTWNGTTGTAGSYVVATPGAGGIGSTTGTATLTVTSVNDAPTFSPASGTGKLLVPVGAGNDYGRAVVMLADGRILVAGNGSNGSNDDMALVRLNADGTLDTTFSGDGKLLLPIGTSADVAYGLTVMPDGRILVVGTAANGGNDDFAVALLKPDGTLDTTFSGDGKLTLAMATANDRLFNAVVQPDGKLLVTGWANNGTNRDFALLRYNTDGTLDTTFSGDGKLLVPVTEWDQAYAMGLQADGKIVMAGSAGGSSTSTYDFAVIRVNADGSLDTTFSGDGKLTLAFGTGLDQAQALVIQPDGKIVVAGYAVIGSTNDFALVRFNADGSLDTTFGTGGKLTLAIGTGSDVASALALQSDGKIIVVGTSNNGTNDDIAVVRLNTNGTLDTSFDGDGKLLVPMGSGADGGLSVTVQPDGRIVVVGYGVGTNNDVAIVRINANGSLDTRFGGTATNTLGSTVAYTENAAAVALDGSVSVHDADLASLASGAGNYGGASVTIARQGGASAEDVFSARGTLSFSSGNALLGTTTVGTVSNAAGTLAITFASGVTQAQVDTVLSSIGYSNTSNAPPASVVLAWTFSDGNTGSQGSGGTLTATGTTTIALTAVNDVPVLDASATLAENAVTSTGTTVAAMVADGSITDADGTAVEAIAIEAVDATLGSWQYRLAGSSTWQTLDATLLNASTNTLALLLGPNDSIRFVPFGERSGSVSAGLTFRAWDRSSGSAGQYVVTTPGSGAFGTASDTVSLTVSAVDDAPTFAPVAGTGKLTLPIGSGEDYAYALRLQPDGKLLVAGVASNGSNDDFALARLNADGTLDTTFDADGKLLLTIGTGADTGRSVVLQPDGRILVAGFAANGTTLDFALARLNADGSLDTSFGTGGRKLLAVGTADDRAFSVVVQPDGKILVAGHYTNGSTQDAAVFRLNADGSTDTSFDTDGKQTVSWGTGNDYAFQAIVQPDGKVLLVGYASNGTNNDVALARLNADGSLDTGFDGDGKVLLTVGTGKDQATRAVVQPDGKIVIVGQYVNGTNDDIFVIRLNANGSLDTSFGTGGRKTFSIGSGNDSAQAVALQADGRIVIAGYASNGTNDDLVLVRLNAADGSLDTSFDGDGKLTVAVGTGEDRGFDLVVQPDGRIVVAGHTYNGTNRDVTLVRVNADGSLDATFSGASANTLGGTVATTENAAAIALDASVRVYDAELAALASGAGDYGGASITLARQGRASVDDVFSARGTLSFSSGNALLGTTAVGTVTNAAGTLTITFASGTTQAQVDTVLSSIGYANASDSPPASVVLVWTFSDGNTGSQGSGDAQVAVGTTTVSITTVNDAPTLSGVPATAQDAEVGIASELADIVVADRDGDTLTLTLNTTGGTLHGLEDAAPDVAGLQLVGTAASINEALIDALFVPDAGPGASISRSLTDGRVASPTAATYSFSVSTVAAATVTNHPPVLDATAVPTAFSIVENAADPAGTTVAALLADGSITDADGTAVEAIAIESVDGSLGTWQYKLSGTSTWLSINAALIDSSTNRLALLLGPDDAIRLLPFGDVNGTVSAALSFRAWDQTTGTAGQYVIDTPGAGAFSLSSDTISATVTAVNDAPTFAPAAGAGQVVIPVGTGLDAVYAAVLQPDGKMLLGGIANDGTRHHMAFVRLNADGTLDTSFDGDGRLILPYGDGHATIQSLALLPDGRIIAGGSIVTNNQADFALLRLEADGTVDTAFYANTSALLPLPPNDVGYGVVVQPDGRIVIAGTSGTATTRDLQLFRVDTDGTLDASFGTGGSVTTSVGANADVANAVALQANGRIVVAGSSNNGTNDDFAIARYLSDGTLDTSFSGDGLLTLAIGSGNDVARSVRIQRDGKIIVAGNASNGTNDDFAIVRLNADGSLDTGFGSGGTVLLPMGTGTDQAYDLVLQPDGKILVTGYGSAAGRDFAIARLNADGSLDTSFSDDGIATTTGTEIAYAALLQPDGRIVMAGYTTAATADFAVVRLTADGSPDTSFGGAGANTLGGTTAFTEDGAAVALDASVRIHDADLAALASGAGDYGGSAVTIARQGGASSQDVFSARGTVAFVAGTVVLNGSVPVGTVSNAGGTLSFTFAAGTTQAQVDTVLSSIGYANTSDSPPASVVLAWTFSDGNTGAQGSGSALTASGTSTVTITAVNDPPVLSGLPDSTQTVGLGRADALADVTVADPDATTLRLTLTATHGTIGGLVDADATTAGIQLIGTAAQIDAAFADATFTGTDPGAAEIALTLTDGSGGTASATMSLTVVDYNTVPTLNTAASPALPALDAQAVDNAGTTVAALVVDGSITDPDGAVESIALTAVDTSLGTWQVRLAGTSTWIDVDAARLNDAATEDALLLSATDSIRLVPSGAAAGTYTGALIFSAWDESSFTRGTYRTIVPGERGISTQSDTASITLTDTDDPPTLSGVPASAQRVTVGVAAALDDVVVADPDSTSLTLTLTSSQGTVGGLTDADPDTAGIQLTGSADEISAALADATFTASAGGSAAIQLSLSDGGPGSPVTATYTFVANDRPTLDASATPGTITVAEGATAPSGITVAALVADGSIADGDGAVEAIAIEALDTSLGAWQYRLAGTSTWLTIDAALLNSATNALALLLGPADSIRLLPSGELGGSAANAITFRAWDRTAGSAGQYVAATGDAFSAASDTAAATVTAIDDAPTFSPVAGTGMRLVPIGPDSDVARALVVQPDGRLLVAGSAWSGSTYDMALARVNADGSLDTSFGTAGTRLLPIGAGLDSANAVALQSDGRIVVAGVSSNGTNTIAALARLNVDGSLDTSFSGDGLLTVTIGQSYSVLDTVVVQPDGRILAAGVAFDGTNETVALVRVNADGSLDTSFGTGGTLLQPVGPGWSNAWSVAVQPDGRILVAGSASNGSNWDVGVARLNADGSLDTTFGSGGTALLPIGAGNDYGTRMVVQPDGAILVTGSTWNGANEDFALLRLTANGTLDTSFGGDGIVDVPIGVGTDVPYSVATQPDGKIVVAGFASNGSNHDLAIVRYTAAGVLDTSFSGDGMLTLDVAGGNDIAWAVAVQPDGRIVVSGSASSGGTNDFVLVRLNADGSLDPTFNGTAAATLGGTASFTEDGPAVALDTAVAVYDADLASLAGGVGDYGGATLAIARTGTPSTDDVFGGRDGLVFDTATLEVKLNGTTVGTFTRAGGTLAISFAAGTTQAQLNAVASRITYSNGSDTPPASVTIGWTFSDGNTGSQGPGGALTATGSTLVTITAHDDAPVISGLPTSAQTVGMDDADTLADFTVSDPDDTTLTLTLTATNGSIGGLVDADATTAGIQLTGTAAQIDAAVANATFTARGTGSASITLSLSDGTAAPTVATYAMTAIRRDALPVLDVSASPSLPTIAENASSPTGTTIAALIVGGSITDTDGAVESIAITALNASLGTWQYRLSGTAVWRTIDVARLDDANTDVALLLSAADSIRLVPNGRTPGAFPDALAFRAWDEAYFTHGTYQAIEAGHRGISVDQDTAAITVTAVNDAPTFGPPRGAFVATLGNSVRDYAEQTIALPDGKVLVIGGGFFGAWKMFAARYNADGTLDPSFGDGGIATASLSGMYLMGHGATVLADGSIVVVGEQFVYGPQLHNFAMARFTADGQADTSFGNAGIVRIDHFAANASTNAIRVVEQADGHLVVLAATDDWVFSLLRFNADGSLDTAWGTSGRIALTFNGANSQAYDLIQAADGDFLVAGRRIDPGNQFDDFAVLRVNADGTLETGFGTNGTAVVDRTTGTQVQSVVEQADGRILLVGGGGLPGGSGPVFLVTRLTASGAVDTTYGTHGTAAISFPGQFGGAQDAVLQPDGKLAVFGTWYNSGYVPEFALVRLNADGSVDTSFGTNGRVQIDVDLTEDAGASITLLADGSYVLVGRNGVEPWSREHAAIAHVTASGQLDPNFGDRGMTTLAGGSTHVEGGAAVVIDASVQLIDEDLTVLANGDGDYSGSTLTLARQGGAKAQDLFSGAGNLTLDSGTVTLSNVAIGTYTQSSGTLSIAFNHDATQARLNEALSSLAYANTSDRPDTSVTLAWTFSDGNTAGDQGTGGTLSVTSTALVNVTRTNDAPTGGVSFTGTAQQNRTLTASNTLADADGLSGAITYQWQRDGVNIAGATAATYKLTLADVGRLITVAASYIDDCGTRETVTSSPSAAVLAAPPPVIANGTSAADTLTGKAGDDQLYGLGGNDTLNGDVGDDLLDGGTGSDRMTGSDGDDTYVVDSIGDVVVELANEGSDTIRTGQSTFTLGANVENLVYTGLSTFSGIGNALDNVLTGGAGNDTLGGLDGNDVLNGSDGADTLNGGLGADSLNGGNGLDMLVGGAGRDVLTGGAGADRFVWSALGDSGLTAATRDLVADFVTGSDRLDVSAIDANTALAGDQAFTWRGTQAITGAGQLSMRYDVGTNTTVISGNVDADLAADVTIALVGDYTTRLTAADLLL